MSSYEENKKKIGIHDYDNEEIILYKLSTYMENYGIEYKNRVIPIPSSEIIIDEENLDTIRFNNIFKLSFKYLKKNNLTVKNVTRFYDFLDDLYNLHKNSSLSIEKFYFYIDVYMENKKYSEEERTILINETFNRVRSYITSKNRSVNLSNSFVVKTYFEEIINDIVNVSKMDKIKLEEYENELNYLKNSPNYLNDDKLYSSIEEEDESTYEVELDTSGYFRDEDIFNDVELDSEYQYCSINIYDNENKLIKNVYKFYHGSDNSGKSFNYNEDWLVPLKDNTSTIEIKFLRNDVILTACLVLSSRRLLITFPTKSGLKGDEIGKTINKLVKKLHCVEKSTKIIKSSGFFKIKSVDIIEPVMSYLFMNVPRYRDKFSFRETSLLLETNRKITYIYTDSKRKTCKFTIHTVTSKINESFDSMKLKTFREEDGTLTEKYIIDREIMKDNSKYIRIYYDTDDVNLVWKVRSIFLNLLRNYLDDEKEVLEIYSNYIEGFNKDMYLPKYQQTINESNIKDIKRATGNLLPSGYVRRCQSKFQPIIVNDDELKDFELQYPDDKPGHVRCIKYPKKEDTLKSGGNQWNFCCPGSSLKYIGLVDTGHNNYYPCCYKSSKDVEGSNLDAYYNNTKTNAQIRKENVRNTQAFVFNEDHKVPPNVSFILTKCRNDISFEEEENDVKKWQLLSFGEDNNLSFLCCILTAIDSNFKNKTITNKINYLKKLLNRDDGEIIKGIDKYTSSLKQELPELSVSEMKDMFSGEDFNLDSKITTSFFERYYDINIVVFTSTSEEPDGDLEIPKTKLLHFETYLDPNINTVLVLKEIDNNDNVTYNLIIRSLDEVDSQLGDYIPVATNDVIDSLNDIITERNRSLVWRLDPRLSYNPDSYNMIKMDEEFNIVCDLRNIFVDESKFQGEYIDNYGKLRFLNYNNITFVTPLTKPIGHKLCRIEDVKRSSVEHILKTLDSFKGVGENDVGIHSVNVEDDNIVGIWWYKSAPTLKTLFFCPCEPTPVKNNFPQLPNKVEEYNILNYPPLVYKSNNKLNYYSYIVRVKYFIFEIIKYCFIIFLKNTTNGLFGKEHHSKFASYFIVSENGDFHNYNLDEIDGVFPQEEYKSIDDALRNFNAPSFIRDNKIIITSEDLIDKIISFATVYYNTIRGDNLKVPKIMNNYYKNAGDYKNYSNNILFDSKSQVLSWMKSLNEVEQISRVYSSFEPRLYDEIKHYTFRYRNFYFLVQNVQDGDLRNAMSIVCSWNSGIVNKGYNCPSYNIPINIRWKLVQVNQTNRPTEYLTFPDDVNNPLMRTHLNMFDMALTRSSAFPDIILDEHMIENGLFYILSYPGQNKRYAAMLFLSEL